VDMEGALLASFRDGRIHGTRVEEKTPSIRRWIWWPAAAAVVIGIVVTGWFSGLFGTSHDYVLLEAKGMVKQVRLADGSMVWLRPGSRLRFDQKAFGMKERLMELERGEVFFDVVHDANKPFVVQTGRVQTTDIGTSFDIKNEMDNVVVTVASGEVKVSHDRKELGHVLPGNQVSVAAGTGRFVSRTLPLWMAYIWKENHIQLNNVSFDELVMAIQQLYGINLQTKEERISRQTFTMQLSRKTGGEEVIKVICLFNQNQYKKNADGSYLIY
jgi:transmembrane sensor